MPAAGAALATAGLGFVAAFIAQASEAVPPEVTTWVSAGGATAAVGGLVYVARLLASGRLVSYPVEKLMEDALAREDRMHVVLESERQRHDDYRAWVVAQRERPDDR